MLFGLNPLYWVFSLPALLLALAAQAWVRGAYRKYLDVPNANRVTGQEAARELMRATGLQLQIERSRGTLSDHYDPRSGVLRLSEGVARRPSVASVAIVAHEMGHALQDAKNYLPLKVRSGLVPVVNFTSWLGPILFFIGYFFNSLDLARLGVLAFGGAVVFALITLPVEINASRRALSLLKRTNILRTEEERQGARRVLTAAALTYVAALAQALSTLLYYVFLLSGLGGRRRN